MPPPSSDLVLVQVRLMGRTLSLRVHRGDEPRLHAWATDLDRRLAEFRRTFPTQPEVVAVLTVALGLAEEVHTLREAAAQQDATDARFADALVALDLRLAAALSPRAADVSSQEEAQGEVMGEDAFDDEGDDEFEDDDFDALEDGTEDAEGQNTPAPPGKEGA